MGWREAEERYEDAVIGDTTLSRAFAESAQRHADAQAQAYKGGVYDRSLAGVAFPSAPDGEFAALTYAEMHDAVRRLAAGFRDRGVAPDDRVAIHAHTRMEWAQCDLALLAAGAVVTAVYPGSSTGQVEYLLGDSDASGVVVENADLLERALAADVDLEFAVVMDGEAPDREGVHSLADVYRRGDPAGYGSWLDERSPGDLASLIYTSGTTGRPKGVRLTHRNFKSNVDQCRKRFGPRPDRDLPAVDSTARAVSFLPLAHVFERLVGHFFMFASGATVAYAESPDTLREDFAAVSPTCGTSVPRVYERIYDAVREEAASSPIRERIFRWATRVGRAHAEADDPGPWLRLRRRVAEALVFSKVKAALGGEIDYLVSGGGSLSPDLCALYHGMGIPILEGYGLTETAPVISVNPPEAPRIGTIGPPVVDLEVRLDAYEAEGIDAEGEVGELLVRGPNVTDGYWRDPDATDRAFTDGWFRTGDIVERGPEGYLTFRERRTGMIVLSTGKNVAPGPIEDAFAPVDLVEQCMVVGDGRKFVGALIVPDLDAVRTWADREGVDLPDDPGAVCRHEAVNARIEAEVERVNEGFEPHETIKRFRLVPREFTEAEGLLTPTMKKKRRNIRERYADLIEEIYAVGVD